MKKRYFKREEAQGVMIYAIPENEIENRYEFAGTYEKEDTPFTLAHCDVEGEAFVIHLDYFSYQRSDEQREVALKKWGVDIDEEIRLPEKQMEELLKFLSWNKIFDSNLRRYPESFLLNTDTGKYEECDQPAAFEVNEYWNGHNWEGVLLTDCFDTYGVVQFEEVEDFPDDLTEIIPAKFENGVTGTAIYVSQREKKFYYRHVSIESGTWFNPYEEIDGEPFFEGDVPAEYIEALEAIYGKKYELVQTVDEDVSVLGEFDNIDDARKAFGAELEDDGYNPER